MAADIFSKKEVVVGYWRLHKIGKTIMAIYRPPLEEDGQRSSLSEHESSRPSASGPQDKSDNNNRNSISRRMSSTSETMRKFGNENPHMRNLNKFRVMCGRIVNHPKATMLIIVLIVVNAIMMGVATFDFVTDNPEVDHAFEVTDLAFLIIFTIELIMQFIFRGHTLFMDGWLVFDLIIVVMSWSLAELQIIRAFRIFRALRIITRIETMRNLVTALFDIMPRLGAITALLALIFYIFAVLFTQLFGDLELSGDYFTRLHYSLLTLFVMMTMEWADVARECMEQIWWAWAPFMAFIMITGFIVFNLIIAVVCDAVAVIENKEDLEPAFFGGILGSKDMDENEANGYPQAEEHIQMTYEEELVENLSQQISSVLSSQREMLATLESLTKDSLVPTTHSAAALNRRRNSTESEEDKIPEG